MCGKKDGEELHKKQENIPKVTVSGVKGKRNREMQSKEIGNKVKR